MKQPLEQQPCEPGQVFNNSTQTCQQPDTIPCHKGQVFNNSTRTCGYEGILRTGCPEGQIFNNTTRMCELQPKLSVIVNVINDNGGKKVAQGFSYSLTGDNKPPSTVFKGVSGKVTPIPLNPGTVSVVMNGLIPSSSSINLPPNQSYKVSMNNCKNIILKGGQTATCTITVDDQPPAMLNVILNVKNDDGGNKKANDFSYTLQDSKYYIGVVGKGTTHTLIPGTVSVVMKNENSLSSIDFPPDQSYKVLNQCNNINLESDQTATCTITVDDQPPAKLVVITNVINDNLGKKVAKDFIYKIGGPEYYPTTFKSVDGKGTTIKLNQGIVNVDLVGETYCSGKNTFKFGSFDIPNKIKGISDLFCLSGSIYSGDTPDQNYEFSMNGCKNITLKHGITATCTIALNDFAIKPTVMLYHQQIGNGQICVHSDKEDLGCVDINLDTQPNPYPWTFPAFKKTPYGQTIQVCLKIFSQEKCVTDNRDKSSYPIIAPKIIPITAHDKETVKSHGYMEAWVNVHPNGQVDSKINTWNEKHWEGFTGSFKLQFLYPIGNLIGECCYHPYGVNAKYLSCDVIGICKKDSKSKRLEQQYDKISKDVVDATNSLKIILKHDPNPRWDEVGKETIEELRKLLDFSLTIPYTIPFVNLGGGDINLKGNALDFRNTQIGLTFLGFEPKDLKFLNDYTITQPFEADIVKIVMDLFPTLKLGGKNIELKVAVKHINNIFNTKIDEDIVKAKLRVTLTFKLPISEQQDFVKSVIKDPKLALQIAGSSTKIKEKLNELKSQTKFSVIVEECHSGGVKDITGGKCIFKPIFQK